MTEKGIFITRGNIMVSTLTFTLCLQKQGREKGQTGLFMIFFSPATIVAFITGGGLEFPPTHVVTLIFLSKRVNQIKRKPPSHRQKNSQKLGTKIFRKAAP